MLTVLGSINVDLTFRLSHLPAAGETVLTPAFTEAVGGKGANQAAAAARDGAPTRFIGRVGNDGFGASARRGLAGAGVDVSGLGTAEGPTGIAAIFIDGQGRNKIAVASGANGSVEASALDAATMSPGALLVLQMEIPVPEVEAAIVRAKAAGARVLLNLAPALPLSIEALRQVDLLVANEHEAASLCQGLGLQDRDPRAQARALFGRLGATVIVTLGADGAVAFDGADLIRVPALTVQALDTTGAGDCFVGVLAAALMRGAALGAAMQRAAVAGSLACTMLGALPSFPTRDAIDAALAREAAGRSGGGAP